MLKIERSCTICRGVSRDCLVQQKLVTNAVRSQSCIQCDWFSCPTYCNSIRSAQSPIIRGPTTSQLAGLKVSVVIALVSDTTGHLDKLEPSVIHIEAFMDWTSSAGATNARSDWDLGVLAARLQFLSSGRAWHCPVGGPTAIEKVAAIRWSTWSTTVFGLVAHVKWLLH